MSRVYPIQWLDSTFTTRARTEQLLRPDLESGLVTQHDFNLASSFLPGYHRYWPVGYGFLAGSAATSWGRYTRRWSWTANRMFFISTAAGMLGAIYGQIRRAKAHFHFTQQLENPSGFVQALENINQRTGGDTPLGWTIPRAQRRQEQQEGDPDSSSGTHDERWNNPDERVVEAPPVIISQVTNQTPPSPQESPSRPSTRWEEIRVANARAAAKTSSWDALRQSHERERVSDSSQPEDHSGSSRDEGRVGEQAKFDALLEAERKMSRG